MSNTENKFKSFLTFVKAVSTKAVNTVQELALTELKNADKKQKLDETILGYIEDVKKSYEPKTFVGKFIFNIVIKELLIPFLPEYTQLIYNLLKTKIGK